MVFFFCFVLVAMEAVICIRFIATKSRVLVAPTCRSDQRGIDRYSHLPILDILQSDSFWGTVWCITPIVTECTFWTICYACCTLLTGSADFKISRLHAVVTLAFEGMCTPNPSGREICVQKFGNAYQRKEIEKRMPHFKSSFTTKFIKRLWAK